MQLADHLIVVLQGLVDQLGELLGVLIQHLGALLEGQALGAVAAVVRNVAGSLVRQQINVDVVVVQILQQVHDVAVIGDGAGLLGIHVLLGDLPGLVQAVGAVADPALGVTGLDTGVIDLGDDGGSTGDLSGLALSARHAAQTGGHEQTASQVAILRNAQLQTAGVQQGVEGAVDDALGPDVHPAAGGHLAVVGNAQSGSAVEVLLIVEGADHQAIGDDAAGGHLVAVEQAQGVTGHHDQSLLVGHDLQILLDQAILHPVLADLTGLAVGDQLIGIQSDVEVQVVVDHDLDGAALDADALVLVDGLAVQLALGTEAVAIDTAVLLQLLSKLLGHLLVMVGVDVTQSVLNGQSLVRLGQVGLTAGSTTVLRVHLRILRQVVVQLNGHGIIGCHNFKFLLSVKFSQVFCTCGGLYPMGTF